MWEWLCVYVCDSYGNFLTANFVFFCLYFERGCEFKGAQFYDEKKTLQIARNQTIGKQKCVSVCVWNARPSKRSRQIVFLKSFYKISSESLRNIYSV